MALKPDRGMADRMQVIYMMPEERRLKILEILYKDRRATVVDLCERLNSSEATIRRDLTMLEDGGKLERVYGGAIIRSNVPLEKEDTFNEKEGIYLLEKKQIARTAFSYLRENDSIFLDGGTTTLELAKLIGRSRIKITVFTNAPHFPSSLPAIRERWDDNYRNFESCDRQEQM